MPSRYIFILKPSLYKLDNSYYFTSTISERIQKTNTRGISVMTYRYKHNKVEKHYVGNKNSWNKVGKIEGTASETRVVKPRETAGSIARSSLLPSKVTR